MTTELKSFQFRKERQASWRELEKMVERIEKGGLRSLDAAELARLPVVYRSTLSALSVARSISLDRALLEYLEVLSARAYFCVYGSTTSLGGSIGDFFLRRFPVTVRRHLVPIGIAAFVMLCGVLVGWVLTARDADWFYVFVDEGLASGRNPAATTEELREPLFDGGGGEGLGTFASFLFTHNTRVGFLAFALGFLAGVPVFVLMLMNGMMLGAFAALHSSRGLTVEFWGWILPHGFPELWAIILCGGAGLILARAIVFPGRQTRLANLARQGREAGVIVTGCIALFLVAGLVEGFFRQLVTNTAIRYVVAAAGLAILVAYFGLAGRTREAARG
ncbi:MAG: stage II sporulation protein M [Planctomycetota bacterium]